MNEEEEKKNDAQLYKYLLKGCVVFSFSLLNFIEGKWTRR
jgi:hypothetical protein